MCICVCVCVCVCKREGSGIERDRLLLYTHYIYTSFTNISNLRYADDTTLMAESEEDLKSPLVKVKEVSEKAGLKLNIQKSKIMASGATISWIIEREKKKQ